MDIPDWLSTRDWMETTMWTVGIIGIVLLVGFALMKKFKQIKKYYQLYQRMRQVGLVKHYLSLYRDRWELPLWDIGLVLLLIVGELIATVIAGVAWKESGWGWKPEFALFIGSSSLVIYALGAMIRGHIPFAKLSEYEQRRKYAQQMLGVSLPMRQNKRASKPQPVVLDSRVSDNPIRRFAGELYCNDMLGNPVLTNNIFRKTRPEVKQEFEEAMDLLLPKPKVIIGSREYVANPQEDEGGNNQAS